MRQDLYLVVPQKRLPVRFSIIPAVLGIGNVFHRQLRIRRHLFRKGKILILIGVDDAGQLNVLPQHVRRWTMNGKLHDLKSEHLAEHVDLLHDLFPDQIHIGQTVQGEMQTDLMASFMHVVDHVHIPFGKDIIGIVGPLEKIGGREVHGKLQLGKSKGAVYGKLHIMAHDDELILPPRLLEIGHPAALLNDLYDLFVFFVGKHVCNLHIRFDGRPA